MKKYERYQLLAEEELNQLARFPWWWGVAGLLVGLILSAAVIAAVLVLS